MRFVVAYTLIVLFWIMDMISLGIPEFQTIKPAFILVIIFYWSIYRPTLMPSWLVFVMGIILDLVTGMPVGLNALVLVMVQRIMIDQRLTFMGQPFSTVFFGYISVAAIFYGVQWSIFGVVHNYYINFEFVLGRFLIAIILFPLLYLTVNLTHKILPYEKRREKAAIGNMVVSRR